MTAARTAAKRAVLASLQALGSSRLDFAGLAELIAEAPRTAPLRCGHHVYAWADNLRAGIGCSEAAARRVAFGELARVVFDEAEKRGPDSLPAAYLRLLAAVAQDLDSVCRSIVSAVVYAASCEACSWHPGAMRDQLAVAEDQA